MGREGSVRRTTLVADPGNVRAARRFIEESLASGELAELTDLATLLTSELVTNAFVHASSRVELEITTDTAGIRVEVVDWGDGTPEVQPIDLTTVGGRGLALVSTIANDWGTSACDGSKVVWFELLV